MQSGESPLPDRGEATRIGRYDVVCKLGVGGMADVYLAHQPGPFSAGKLVVLKQLRMGGADDAQFLQMFADESRIAVRLSHPNVVHTYEAVAEGDDYYLILEFLNGKSLYQVLQVLKRERVPLELHLWVLTQVLAGLQYAHDLKDFDDSPMHVVHRDVSPSNVFVTYEGDVKILDFGIAKSTAGMSATREGIIKGKLGYASPEQCLCQETDRRTDIYAVGVMLWEALACRKRSLGETSAATYQARVQGAEPPIEQVAPTAPGELVGICNRALMHEPKARFQTALEFRQALDGYLGKVGWTDGSGRVRAFMQEHFALEIADMRKRIDAHLLRTQSNGERVSMTPLRPGSIPPVSGTLETRALQSSAPENATRESIAASFRRHKRQVALGAVVGAALACAGAATLILSRAKTNDLPGVEPANAAPAAEAHGNSLPVNPLASPSQKVTLALSASPSSAQLRLDGRPITNPYNVSVAQDRGMHHLTVEAEGYQTLERELSFERSIEATFALLVAPPSPAATTLPSPPTKSPPNHAQARLRQVTGTKSASPTGFANAGPAPGEDLRGGLSRTKTRDIEEMDPYKR